MSLLQNSNAISDSSYNIANSLRFQSASSQYLNRTMTASGSRQKFTVSMWIKRGLLNSTQALFSVGTGVVGDIAIGFGNGLGAAGTGDTITFGYAGVGNFNTTAVFRDPSAWYHVVISFDTTNATAANRLIIYINNSAYPLGSNIALNALININQNGSVVFFGRYVGINYFDGYMTEINFVDGQALTPSSFGETNTLTGQWVAKKYTGTYGTNGFYLPFSNGTSTTTLGYDSSGNSNNWTLTNFTRSAGVSDCWMNDVPSGNGSSVGGTQPNSNYAVINPLKKSASATITNGNLTVAFNANGGEQPNTIAVSSGKWYWEITPNSAFSAPGIILSTATPSASSFTQGYRYYGSNGQFYTATSGVAYGATFTNGDIVGIALDLDTNQITFYKNNVSQGAKSIVAGEYNPDTAGATTVTINVNFGQRSFAYTPPSGFKALCTANLPASTIVKGNEYMDATTYSGNSSTQNIVNAAGFSPDLVWIKSRSGALSHYLSDTIRGAYKILFSNLTNAEFDGTSGSDGVSAFNSNGFTLLNGSNVSNYNQSGSTYVAWQWDAGSSTVTNTNGTISSQVRANPTAGVSVVTYTGTGTTATVGHGLGVAPKMIISKARTLAGGDTGHWAVQHAGMPSNWLAFLNLTGSIGAISGLSAPTSSVFTAAVNSGLNANGATYVAYCFAEIPGFSKMGSYTGNASTDGPFIYTGFKPKFVLIKSTSVSENWNIIDSSRSPSNLNNLALFPSLSNAESANIGLDLLSNGFKLRTNNTVNGNASGATYIYTAFAENPFQNSNAR